MRIVYRNDCSIYTSSKEYKEYCKYIMPCLVYCRCGKGHVYELLPWLARVAEKYIYIYIYIYLIS